MIWISQYVASEKSQEFPGIFQDFPIVGAVGPACCSSPAEKGHEPAVVAAVA